MHDYPLAREHKLLELLGKLRFGAQVVLAVEGDDDKVSPEAAGLDRLHGPLTALNGSRDDDKRR
jgi:hypothetical protein